jgi:hypothetical protein
MVKAFFAVAVAVTGIWMALLGWLIVSGIAYMIGPVSAEQPNRAVHQATPHQSADLHADNERLESVHSVPPG